jgi:hypothetical protein
VILFSPVPLMVHTPTAICALSFSFLFPLSECFVVQVSFSFSNSFSSSSIYSEFLFFSYFYFWLLGDPLPSLGSYKSYGLVLIC